MQRFHTTAVIALACVAVLCANQPTPASLIDFRSTPDGSGVHGENGWAPPLEGVGFRIDWTISQNPDNTWHYRYEFSDQNQNPLTGLVSHIILQLSDDAQPEDLFNFTGDIGLIEFGTYGPSPGNPGFPAGESIFGVKINLSGDQMVFEFDSMRQPMWGDFYAKDGGDPEAFCYNTDLGVPVADPNAYYNPPVDVLGNPLHKILTPDTYIPEPATLSLLAVSAVALLRGRRGC